MMAQDPPPLPPLVRNGALSSGSIQAVRYFYFSLLLLFFFILLFFGRLDPRMDIHGVCRNLYM